MPSVASQERGDMSNDDDFLHEINRLNVTPALLGEVMILWASLSPDEWSDFDRRLERVVQFVGAKLGGEDNAMLAMAAALRLMALDDIVVDPEFRGWRLSEKTSAGVSYIHGDLLKVAAGQPLLDGPAGNPVFDREAFRAGLMALIAAHGRA